MKYTNQFGPNNLVCYSRELVITMIGITELECIQIMETSFMVDPFDYQFHNIDVTPTTPDGFFLDNNELQSSENFS
jgi:hypothetical protein